LKKISIVLGTRPEIIKLAELIKILKSKKDIETEIIFTGQHYDYNMYRVFMEELALPKPNINLGINGGSNAEQVSAMLKILSRHFSKNHADIVVAQGDTNSVLAAAMAAYYSGIRFAHVEAGLRSFDWKMPEEANRVLADQLSSLAFAPTKVSEGHLKKGGCRKEAIYLTGNTIVEAVEKNLESSGKSKILEKFGLEAEKYAVLTAHRQEYVDKKENLEELLFALEKISAKIVFPAHPRTIKNLKKFGLRDKANKIKNLQIAEPVGYFDFLQLASNSMFLLSDSGGIQEEASVYKKWVIVLRDNTERPEIIGKFGCITGYNAEKILKESRKIIENYAETKKRLKKLASPFGDGTASKKIADILVKSL